MVNCVYIHIPFCEKKCKYCAFCSFELLSTKDEYIEALLEEINYFYKKEKLNTLYLGGGTPSLLDSKDIEKILERFNFKSNYEITLELNPNLITLNKLEELKSMGVNRFSTGVQSFDDETLKELGRTHSKKEIIKTLNLFNKVQIDNYSIDLMYGLPNQTLDKWIETLEYALNFDIKHISLYGLLIEKGTYFNKFPPKNLPDSDLQAKMYEAAIEILNKRFIHYEFSNFAKNEEYYSKHNLAYWKRKNYYGFGLSASGFIENKRYTNTYNLKKYIQNPIEKNFEILTTQQEIEEEIFLNLRTIYGLNIKEINKKYNIDIRDKYKKEFNKFIKEGFLNEKDNIIKFSKKGILLSNEVLCEFIEV